MMKTIKGTVHHIHHMSEVGGGGYFPAQSISTTHVALIELANGRRIKYSSREPICIAEGDQVGFVGTRDDDGIFHCSAYRNLSGGVRGEDRSYLTSIYYGLGLLTISPVAMFAFQELLSVIWGAVIGSLVGVTGVVAAVHGFFMWRSLSKFRSGSVAARNTVR